MAFSVPSFIAPPWTLVDSIGESKADCIGQQADTGIITGLDPRRQFDASRVARRQRRAYLIRYAESFLQSKWVKEAMTESID